MLCKNTKRSSRCCIGVSLEKERGTQIKSNTARNLQTSFERFASIQRVECSRDLTFLQHSFLLRFVTLLKVSSPTKSLYTLTGCIRVRLPMYRNRYVLLNKLCATSDIFTALDAYTQPLLLQWLP